MSNKLAKKSSIAIERGKRIRFVRGIIGMTMERFGHWCGVSRTTVNCWEQGINPLSKGGADKVVRALHGEGIRCSRDWLLTGIGSEPKIVDQNKLSKLHYQALDYPMTPPRLEEMPLSYNGSDLALEIDLFKKCFPEHLLYFIQDDAMWPLYRQEDWVGGVKFPTQSMDLIHGMDCVVQIREGGLMVRRAKVEGFGTARLSLYGINAEASVEYPPLRHITMTEIIAIAPIIRVWRKSLKN